MFVLLLYFVIYEHSSLESSLKSLLNFNANLGCLNEQGDCPYKRFASDIASGKELWLSQNTKISTCGGLPSFEHNWGVMIRCQIDFGILVPQEFINHKYTCVSSFTKRFSKNLI